MQPLIDLRQITKIYQTGNNEQKVLNGINLQINPGEQLAIMGPSGCGKSTLMNIIGLLDQPTQGDYFLQGRPVTSLVEDERAALRNKTIGFVFQSFFLLPRLTALQNVGLPLRYHHHYTKHEIDQRAMQLLQKMGLENLHDHKPNQLSGGQQQRVAIARALVGNPAVILADEPTGALDSATGQMIMALFAQLNQQDGVTIVIVTHDPHVAAQCNRKVHIHDGNIVED